MNTDKNDCADSSAFICAYQCFKSPGTTGLQCLHPAFRRQERLGATVKHVHAHSKRHTRNPVVLAYFLRHDFRPTGSRAFQCVARCGDAVFVAYLVADRPGAPGIAGILEQFFQFVRGAPGRVPFR
jgi:hypothetical protein